MDDADLVALVASDYTDRYGRSAVAHLQEQKEIAAARGDTLSAEAWHDIAAAAALISGEGLKRPE